MYTDYFSLTEKPFSITPDPAFLFLSKRHEEALAHLLYGVTDSGGFIQLTGEVGTGKTTIIRSLFERIPRHVEIALILNPRLSESEFLHAICDELVIDVTKESSNKECFDALNTYLLDAHANGRKVVLLVDEAQNLAVNVLEYIRLLTNLETDKDKLLQIILVGQPELQTLLQRQDLRQLAQRITARYHLVPLNKLETHAYIEHRLRVAGSEKEIFTKAAKNKIFTAAKGIPRLINVLSDRALLGAYSQEKHKIDAKLAVRVISEVLGEEVKDKTSNMFFKLLPMALILGVAGVFLTQWLLKSSEIIPPPAKISQNIEAKIVEKADIKFDETANTVLLESPPSAETNIVVADELPEESVKDLASLLVENINETTAEQSIQALLAMWGQSQILPIDDICLKVKKTNLRCLFRKSQWQDLVNVNRPVILELRDAKNIIHHLLIKHADSENALVKLGEREWLVPLNEIIAAWRGDYLLFWQPDHAALDASIQFGSSGADVLWLKEKLTELNVLPRVDISDPNFGGLSKKQVESFQRESGLLVDGIVGRETFIAINNALDLQGRPKLIQEKLLEGAN